MIRWCSPRAWCWSVAHSANDGTAPDYGECFARGMRKAGGGAYDAWIGWLSVAVPAGPAFRGRVEGDGQAHRRDRIATELGRGGSAGT